MRWLGLLCCVFVGCAERQETPAQTTAGSGSSTSHEEDPYGEDDGGLCDNAALEYGPTELPEALVGEPYSVNVRDHAESGWWGGAGYDAREPPPGLEWDEDGLILSGVPTETGYFELVVEAIHSSPGPGECGTHPDPHTFDLFVRSEPMTDTVTDGGGDTDGETDAAGDSSSSTGRAQGDGPE